MCNPHNANPRLAHCHRHPKIKVVAPDFLEVEMKTGRGQPVTGGMVEKTIGRDQTFEGQRERVVELDRKREEMESRL